MSDRPVPERIQRKRTKGWRMPTGAVYVGRPTRWGNPFQVGDPLTKHFSGASRLDGVIRDARHAVDLYSLHTGAMGNYELDDDEVRDALAGRDLVCWCPLDQPCHADVLLEIANGDAS